MKKNVVRILALVLVGLMVLSLLPLVTYASDWCEHPSWTTVRVDPVCGEDGYTAAVCEVCGFTRGEEIIPHTEEHDFSACVEDWDYLISEGNCLEPSLYYKSCSKCGMIAEFAYQQAMEQMQQSLWDQYNREVAYYGAPVSDWEARIRQATEDIQNTYTFKVGGDGHRFYEVEGQEATCTSDGWTPYRVCEVCGEIEGYETIPAKGHRFGEWAVTKEPTCTEDGVRERVCEVCGEKETEAVPATGHQGAFTTIKAPTCTEPGSEKRICTVCQTEEVREIPALGHKGPFVVTKEATCTEPGEQERICEVCGVKETAPVPAAHKYGEDNLCVFCGAENPIRSTVSDTETFGGENENGADSANLEQTPDARPDEEQGEQVIAGAEEPAANENEAKTENEVKTENETKTEDEVKTEDGAKTENETKVEIETRVEDTETYEAGQITSVKIMRDGIIDDEGMVGDVLTLVAEPTSLHYTYKWYRITKEGAEPTFIGTGETYTLTANDVPYEVNCTVYAENDSAHAKSADNSIHARMNVPFPVNIKNGNDTANTVVTTNEDKVNHYPVDEIRYPDAEAGVTNPFNIDAKTENEVTLTANPGSGYVIRWVKEGTSEGSAVTRIPASAEPKTYTISSVSKGQANNQFWVYFDTYEVNIDKDKAIQPSDIQSDKNPDIRRSFTDAYVKNGEPYQYYYVTPMWKGDPATPITDSDITALGGFTFDLDLPDGVTLENYKSYDIHLYHYVKSTDVWEEVDFKLVKVIENGVEKLKAKVSNFTNFSPFGIVAVPTLSLSLAPGEGTGEMEPITALSGEPVTVPQPAFTAPAGKTFGGWKDEATGTEYKIGDSITLTKNLTLTAQWVAGYTVTFDDNDADNSDTYGALVKGEMTPQYVTEGVEALSKNQFTLKNHEFKGWSFDSGVNNIADLSDEAGIDEIQAAVESYNKAIDDGERTGTKLTYGEDLTVHAVWKKTYYTITFNGNGGSGTMNNQTAQMGSSITLNKNAFTAPYENKIFGGWSTTKNGNVVYKDGETIPEMTGDLDLWAVWKDKVAIHFYPDSDSGAGTGTMSDQYVPSGEATALKANTFKAPTGMAFKEWNTKKDGSGTAYADGANITVTGETYLYAQWRKDAAIVHYDANGGTGTMDDQEIEKGVATQLNANTYVGQPGMAFNGWNTKADGSGTSFKDKATVKVSKDITLYAQWINAATITFNKNADAATGTMDNQVVESGVSTALTANSFKRVNYSFEGWTTNPDGTGDKYADEGVINTLTDVTLYAVWKQIAYAITYDANGGGGDQMAQQNVAIGNTATIRECAYNPKPGEVFAYWQEIRLYDMTTAPEGSSEHGDIYYPGEKIIPTKDLPLKAVWVDELVLSYYPGEGSGTYNEGEVPKGVPTYVKTAAEAKFTAPANATFAYWQDESGNKYYEDVQYKFEQNTKLTAIWAPACTITYNKNASDAKGTMANQTAPSGVEVTLHDNNFTRSEYIFKYWTKTKSDPYPNKRPEDVSSSDVYKDGTSITVTQDTNLYAQWYKTAITKDAVKITGEVTGLDDFAVWGEYLTAVVNDPVLKSGFTYTWLVDGNPAKSGEDNTYLVRQEDYGKTIVCVVSHPQATNEVESNTKIVGTYAESDDLIIINNGNDSYPYSKYAYVYGVVPGTTFYKDGKAYLVPEAAKDGYMEIGIPGTYTFGHATYYIENWYTVGYEVDTSGGGTVTMKNGATTLTSSTKTSDIQHFTGTIWLVRDGSATDLNITMKPASSTYVHWAINGGSYSSSGTEVSRRLGTINQPMLFSIVFNKSSSSPKTGDMSQLGMWSALCFSSLVGAAGLIGSSKKRRKNGK